MPIYPERPDRFRVDNRGFTAESVAIGDLSTKQLATVFENLISVSVDYSIDEESQLSIELIDPQYKMANGDYFEIGRDILWTQSSFSPFFEEPSERLRLKIPYEIASVEIGPGPGESPRVTIEARPKGVQQMKRDRNPRRIKGNGSAFVENAAMQYGLRYEGQRTEKKKTINKASGTQQADSVWDVIRNLAQEAEFVVFEVDSLLVFSSEKFLMGKWGMVHGPNIPVGDSYAWLNEDYGSILEKQKSGGFFIPLEFPTPAQSPFKVMKPISIRRSDQDPYEGTGSVIVERNNGTQLRPGMTVFIKGHPFGGFFLITRVSFKENSPEPVTVEFRSPAKQEKDLKNKLELAIGQIQQSGAVVGLSGFNRANFTSQPSGGVNASTVRAAERSTVEQRLPSASNGFVYPSSLLDSSIPVPTTEGNINLWDRPIYRHANGNVDSIAPSIYEDGADWVILCRVWCDGSTVELLTEGDAITKYETDNLHLGKFATEVEAVDYADYLRRYQIATIKKRFPSNWELVLSGKLGRSIGC